jgi:hypothetical protein
MTATGFMLYGTNHTGFRFASEPAPTRIQASVGPVPLPHGGLGVGARLSF